MACGPLHIPASKQDAQGYGSALTYARRYSLMAAFGVPAEDDDGNAAVKRPQAEPETISQPLDAEEMNSILTELSGAAAAGPEKLQHVFKLIGASREKQAVWAKHGASLKSVAEKVPA
jgi:hypothetical protein